MVRCAALVALAAAACGTDAVTITPVIDVPDGDSDAAAFPDVDELTVTVAHAGSDDNLVSATFTRGQAVELTDIPFADDLVIHVDGTEENADIAYGRSCAFAADATDPPPTPHIFFSRTVKFAPLAVSPTVRIGGVAVTYHNGAGLLIGGADASAVPVPDVEEIDPNDGSYQASIATLVPRTGQIVSRLGVDDGRVAILGGSDATGTPSPTLELIEVDNPPARRVDGTNTSAHLARLGMTANAMPDSRIIAIGGLDATGAPTDEIDEIAQTTSSGVEIDPLHAVLAHPRSGHTATLLTDDIGAPVLVAGGLDGSGQPVATAELFQSLANTIAPGFAPAMVVPRTGHQAVLMPDGSVMIFGGLDATGTPISTIELFSLVGGFVRATQALPDGAGLIDGAVTTLPDGRVLLTGGRRTVGGPPLDTAFILELDLDTGDVTVVATDNLATPRANHQSTLLCDGTVLVSGGTDTATPAERYNPPALGRR
jgi:hypothetical protein